MELGVFEEFCKLDPMLNVFETMGLVVGMSPQTG
jgi:hypothetical protein